MKEYVQSQHFTSTAEIMTAMKEKILALHSCGVSQRDIAEQIKELYDVEISPDLVTKITEKIMLEVTAWKNRPLEAVYLFVFMDAIHYKVREGHRYVTKAAYVVLGIATDGRKDVKQVAADLKKIYPSVSVRQRMG